MMFVSVLLSACKGGGGKEASNDIRFDSLKVEKTYHLLGDTANPACDFRLSFIYPTHAASSTLLRQIQDEFVLCHFGENYQGLTPDSAVARYTNDYLVAYRNLEKDYKKDLEKQAENNDDDDVSVGAWYNYYEYSQDRIAYNKNGLLSFVVYFESYTGGAHGSHSFNNHVISLSTGKMLTEDDIFIEGYQDKLAKIITDRLAVDNKVANPQDLENIGFFAVDEIVPNGNFLIDAKGITYTYNEYEIAAYVVGPIHVHLTFDDVLPLLKPDTEVRKLIKS